MSCGFSCFPNEKVHYVFNRAGGKAGAVRTCQGCKGRGIKVTIRQIGPGMVQQMQSSCNECSGEGKQTSVLFSIMTSTCDSIDS